MRRNHGAALVCAAVLALTGCEEGPSSGDALLETDAQKASYGIGRDIGTQLTPASEQLDMDAFLRGIEDQFEGVDSPLPAEEIRAATQRFSQTVQEEQQARMQAQAQENQAAGDEFLAEVAGREGVESTGSGLLYEVVEGGDGPTPDPQDQVTIHYHGTLPDGTVFDSSRERGEPATFPVGGVIDGFAEGLQLMPQGSTYRLYIPGNLAYGEQGRPPQIQPNQTLIFEVEMLGIEDRPAQEGPQGG